MKKLVVSSAFLATLALSVTAFAQERGRDAMNCDANGRNCEISFTDAVVQGSLVRPDGVSTGARNKAIPVNLIRIRSHFIPEMLKSVENL